MGEYASAESILSEMPAAEPSAPVEAPASSQVSEISETPSQPTAESSQSAVQESFEIPWNGQLIKADRDKVTKWASQGYDYSQRMNALNQEREQLSKYAQVDEFATKNPDWWNHVEKTWGERETFNLPPEVKSALEPVLAEVSEMKKFVNEFHKEKLEVKAREEDAKLLSEIDNLGKQYNIDFSARDASGKTLEWKIIKHAQENGIQNFATAFRDYHFDQQVKRAEAAGREAAIKEISQRRQTGQLGFPGGNQAPLPAQKAPIARPRNYNDAHLNALAELGLR